MPVPSAVKAKSEREAADLRSQGINPDSGAPLVVQQEGGVPPATPAPPAAAPAPTPPPADEVTMLRARNAELEAEVKTQGGRTSALSKEVDELKSRFDVVNSNRLFLEKTVQEQSEQLAARPVEPAPAPQPSPDMTALTASLNEEGPTEKQKEEFGADGIDFVSRVVRKELAAVFKPVIGRLATLEDAANRVKVIEGKLPRFEENAKVTDMNAARQKEIEFLRAEIIPHFPDFETIRNTPEWRTYLQKDTGRGYSVGQLLATYRQTGDAVNIRALLGTFYDAKKAAPSLESLAVPAKTSADAPPTPAVPKMKSSEYKANLKAFTSKRLLKAEWEAYRARWDEAIKTGNVDMDEEVR